mgnify:CR=1 FL=1
MVRLFTLIFGKYENYNAFLYNQNYGKDIINGFEGLINFIQNEFPHKKINFKHKSKSIGYKYFKTRKSIGTNLFG